LTLINDIIKYALFSQLAYSLYLALPSSAARLYFGIVIFVYIDKF